MRTRIAGLILALLAASCTTPPPPFTFGTPDFALYVGQDFDVWALNMAQWAFADEGRVRGRPHFAARAVAALEYLTSQAETPRYQGLDAIARMQLVPARAEVRATLGIDPAAPPQAVVQALLRCAAAVAAGDAVAAGTFLTPPVFTFGPERTLAVLSALPFQRAANIATMRLGFSGGGSGSGLGSMGR